MKQDEWATLKHQVLKKEKDLASVSMVSSFLHRSAPTESLSGLDVPGDKGLKIIGSCWLWDWLAGKSRLIKLFYFVKTVHWACFKLVLE